MIELKKLLLKKRKKKKQNLKRPKSAYMFYAASVYQSVKSQNENASAPELLQKIAQKWNSLSDAQKQPYNEKAKEDKERYTKQVAEYKKTLPPKRPLSAFMIYSNDVRDSIMNANPNSTFGEIGSIIGEKWRSLSESQKEKYKKARRTSKTSLSKEIR